MPSPVDSSSNRMCLARCRLSSSCLPCSGRAFVLALRFMSIALAVLRQGYRLQVTGYRGVASRSRVRLQTVKLPRTFLLSRSDAIEKRLAHLGWPRRERLARVVRIGTAGDQQAVA